jgi:hypothetical protein
MRTVVKEHNTFLLLCGVFRLAVALFVSRLFFFFFWFLRGKKSGKSSESIVSKLRKLEYHFS